MDVNSSSVIWGNIQLYNYVFEEFSWFCEVYYI